MYNNVYEILEDFEIGEDDYERIDILQRHNLPALKIWLRYVFDKNIVFHNLDFATLEWRREDAPPGTKYNTFGNNEHLIYLFIKNHPKAAPGLTIQRRRQLLVNLLESMEAKEADVFLNMLKKKSGVKGLTKKIAKQAFPDMNL